MNEEEGDEEWMESEDDDLIRCVEPETLNTVSRQEKKEIEKRKFNWNGYSNGCILTDKNWFDSHLY